MQHRFYFEIVLEMDIVKWLRLHDNDLGGKRNAEKEEQLTVFVSSLPQGGLERHLGGLQPW